MRTRLRTMARAAAGLLAGSVLLTGCDFDVYQLPLPGGADVGDDPITVKVYFEDVLDLVPKSSVKVNDVTVGQVSDIELDGYTAEVTLELRDDTGLPDNAEAKIRQTSLLGEKFVSLEMPADPLRRPARRRRRDRERRPQPRGRGGARRAQPGPQRRRCRPAQDDHHRAQPRARGPGGLRTVGPAAGRVADGPARRPQGRHRRSHPVTQPAVRGRPAPHGQHRPGARGAAERARLHRPAALRPGGDAGGAGAARRRRRAGDPADQGLHHEHAPAARAGAAPAQPRREVVRRRPQHLLQLPVRRRRHRPRPRGRAQHPHGRLRQPLRRARPRPADAGAPGPAVHRAGTRQPAPPRPREALRRDREGAAAVHPPQQPRLRVPAGQRHRGDLRRRRAAGPLRRPQRPVRRSRRPGVGQHGDRAGRRARARRAAARPAAPGPGTGPRAGRRAGPALRAAHRRRPRPGARQPARGLARGGGAR
ncbi:MCE family protein [Nocardioides sp. TF02-7]|uniref:MlaD family protein n=1 Tax=Nocardioides sp. TF02-7 TaxID=2917724 RepID=UPI001F06430C|nr:MCE family protein [Nocardioides sp. TF02-7]UMG93780.1 MCE family protein [Nocardioides sp. TF02-7]